MKGGQAIEQVEIQTSRRGLHTFTGNDYAAIHSTVCNVAGNRVWKVIKKERIGLEPVYALNKITTLSLRDSGGKVNE